MTIKLLKIRTDDPANNQGFYLLEEQDFNKDKHTLWTPEQPKPVEPPKQPAPPPPANGKK